ncbi:MAG TPA: hypothetical protein DEH27_05115 [Deltaproteobacteria bacterium]|nr:hypothetical protein [Deltaproteobacteria bacterium]
MKTLLFATMAGMLLMVAIPHIPAGGPLATLVSSSSQIYIHGTPVCVTREGEDIVARVGECGVTRFSPDAESPERVPYHGHPGMQLPPGHPPIDQEMFPEENRRVLI